MQQAFWQAWVKWVEPVRKVAQMDEDGLPLAIMRRNLTMGHTAHPLSHLTLIIILNN